MGELLMRCAYQFVLMAVIVAMLSVEAAGALITLAAKDSGWYRFGEHIPSNTNYITGKLSGDNIYHSFFVFNLSTVTEPILGATFKAFNPGDHILSGTETVQLYDVSTSISTLRSGGGISAFDDLGSGIAYGSTTIPANADDTTISITLNSTAVASLNLASGDFAIGGALTTIGTFFVVESIWEGTDVSMVSLELQIPDPPPPPMTSTPEPASLAVWSLFGLVSLAAARRNKAGSQSKREARQ
jgi:hypothetical protein